MANYDNKLGEWYRQLEKRAQEVKAKKNQHSEPQEETKPQEEAKPVARAEQQPESAQIESQASQAPATTIATIDTSQVVAKDKDIPADDSAQQSRSEAPLFSEETPEVEDFFSFMNKTKEQETDPLDVADTRRFGDRFRQVEPELDTQTPPVEIQPEPQKNSTLDHLTEGTGEPRPISGNQPPVVEERAPVVEQPTEQQPVEAVEPEPQAEAAPVEPAKPEPKPAPAPQALGRVEAEAAPKLRDSSLQEKWDRVPHHLQVLFGASDEEIAQNSYKPFKETRGQLIERLLDPTLSLEETARILNVCPTTVRRYTNRGVLPHYRTAGNQRRFKLSDILSFMEHGTRGAKATSDQEDKPLN